MNEIGYFSLLLALMTATYGGVTSVVGARARNPQLISSGAHGVIATFGMLTLASLALVYQLYIGNFQVEYVASYTSSTLPEFYRVTALWAGQKGSLLLWVWTLSLFALLVHLTNRNRNQSLIPYVHAVMMSVTLFFIVLLIFVADPFELLPFVPSEGRGLNPVLQMPLMIIHPPILYQGYVGTVVPFAFAMAALITGDLSDTWIRTIRRWTLYAWFFLGFGLILGGRWAYVELGWGGYWAWDPVENAALMPWLTITAFLHSVMIQEKKGMLKIWNFALIILTFGLVYFGTFLTRSGVVSSVHSFTTSSIGPMFMGFVVVSMVLSFGLLISRRHALKARNELDSFVSRESGFLLNNLALIGVCFAILWGTIFPVLSEAVSGEKITVSAPYFNQINVPLGIFLLFLTGAGPLFAWRKTSVQSLKRHFTVPVAFFVVAASILLAFGIRHVYALLSLSMCAFVVGAIGLEFYRGVRARRSTNAESFPAAFVRLIMSYKRRYGGYIVHIAIVLMFVGFTGKAFDREENFAVREGESFTIKNYTLDFESLTETNEGEYVSYAGLLRLSVDGEPVVMMAPEKRLYPIQDQVTSEVSIWSSVNEDLYVVLAELNETLDVATFKVYINPLVNWVWIGTALLMLGTIVLFLPDRFGRKSTASERRQGSSDPRTSVPETQDIIA